MKNIPLNVAAVVRAAVVGIPIALSGPAMADGVDRGQFRALETRVKQLERHVRSLDRKAVRGRGTGVLADEINRLAQQNAALWNKIAELEAQLKVLRSELHSH